MADFQDINPELAIYNLIVANTTLTALLATYSTAPAVFFSSRVPEDATYPYIWCPGRVGTEVTDTKDQIGESFLLDLMVVIQQTGSTKILNQITRILKSTLHRQATTLTGGNHVGSLVSGPVPAPLTEDLVGTVLTLEYEFFECPT